MRITIDIDGKGLDTVSKDPIIVPIASMDAMDGGAAAGSTATASLDQDTGGPPAWLLVAVGRAVSADVITLADQASSEDAGSGSA